MTATTDRHGDNRWNQCQDALSRRPRLVDPFCGAGGASRGYQLAGFHVTGIDIEPQPHYIGDEFIQADATELLSDAAFIATFDAAGGSPPCQGYSKMTRCRPGLAAEYPKLIEVVRDLYRAWGGPWIIENIERGRAGRARRPFRRLRRDAVQLHVRPRTVPGPLVRGRFPLPAPPSHPRHDKPASKAGHWKPGTVISVAGNCAPIKLARQVMDIDWTNRDELAESIPPYMTEYLGTLLLAHLASERAA